MVSSRVRAEAFGSARAVGSCGEVARPFSGGMDGRGRSSGSLSEMTDGSDRMSVTSQEPPTTDQCTLRKVHHNFYCWTSIDPTHSDRKGHPVSNMCKTVP